MTKRVKTSAVAPVYGPWMLCIWRGEIDRCHYALVRFSRHQETAPRSGALRAVHAMFVDPAGQVAYKSYPPAYRTKRGDVELRTADLAEPTGVETSVEAMLDYFKRRLLLVGGDKGAYEALGLERPQLVEDNTVVANPEKAKELESLYERAAVVMKVPVSELKTRYSHLNRGLQAMNLRNRLRARGSNV